jgi:hypothetical protein
VTVEIAKNPRFVFVDNFTLQGRFSPVMAYADGVPVGSESNYTVFVEVDPKTLPPLTLYGVPQPREED